MIGRREVGILRGRWSRLALEAAVPVVAVLCAALIGALVIAAIGKDPVRAYATMVRFSFRRLDSVAVILFRATPLIFSGLAVAVGFRAGLFNIGVEGQYFIGAVAASVAGFALKGLAPAIHLPLAIAAALLGGLAWAWLPAWLKTRRGVHEVITTIMLNYIAYSLVHYFISDLFLDRSQTTLRGLGSPRVRMPGIAAAARIPPLRDALAPLGVDLPAHVHLNWLFPLGLLLCAAFVLYIWRSPGGYELRAVGHNPAAARAAGIEPERVQARAFLLSGALAGLVGLNHLLGYEGYLDIDFPKNLGFTGIAVALLGKNHPFGIVAAALLFGFLDRGAEGVQALEGIPMDSIVILQAVLILALVVAAEVLTAYLRRREREAGA